MVDIIVVGYGLAGRIHSKAHHDLIGHCRLAAIVESRISLHQLVREQFPGVRVYDSLEAALNVLGSDVIVDICVPARQNLFLADTIVKYDVKRLMLEKPLGWSVSMAMLLADKLAGRDVVYLDTYRSSLGVDRLYQLLVCDKQEIDTIQIRFNKNRLNDSFMQRGFDEDEMPDAWHIEGPHMVSIATKLAGQIARIDTAQLCDMHSDGLVLKKHGCAKAAVTHEKGVRTYLETDLTTNENIRTVDVRLRDHTRYLLSLPSSKSVSFVSRIEKYINGSLTESVAIEDRPMEQCVREGVDYFLTGDNSILSLDHGVYVNQILDQLTQASCDENSVTWHGIEPVL